MNRKTSLSVNHLGMLAAAEVGHYLNTTTAGPIGLGAATDHRHAGARLQV